MAAKQKSPLNILFGAYLQEQRKRFPRRDTIEDICTKGQLGISTSLYKMIESGHASLAIHRAPDLIRVFEHTPITFDRLLKFIAGQNLVEYLINNVELSPVQAVAQLAASDDEFRYLYNRILDFFDYDEGSQSQKEFIQKRGIQEINCFLENSKYPPNAEDRLQKNLIEKIKAIPSLNVEIVQNIIDSMVSIMPQHFGHIASEWEIKNANNFSKVQGFYLSSAFIVSEDNLRKYSYPYLDNKETTIEFMFHGSEDSFQLQEKFQTILTECRKKAQLSLPNFDNVKFKTLNRLQSEFKVLLEDPLDPSVLLQAFWVFTTKSNEKIGFVGVYNKDVNVVYNLSYEESISRSEMFEQLWQMTK